MSSENTNTAIPIPADLNQKSPSRPVIFEYSDHIEFLKNWFVYLKTAHGLSLRKIAKSASVTHGFLALVLSGKRPLSDKAFLKILPVLQLEKHERNFLNKLRLSEVAKNADTQHAAVLGLNTHRNFKEKNKNDVETFQYLSHWYNIAIRELTNKNDFSENPKWIQKKLAFHVPLKDIRESLEFLEKSGYLMRDQDSRLRSLDKKLFCTPKIFKHSLRSMHETMLNLALKSIDETDASQRMVLGQTLFLGDHQIDRVREILREAREKIADVETESEGADLTSGKVYHVELAGFPLTDAKKRKKS